MAGAVRSKQALQKASSQLQAVAAPLRARVGAPALGPLRQQPPLGALAAAAPAQSLQSL